MGSLSCSAVPIDVSAKGAEVWAELMISNHSLVNFRGGCSIQKGVTKSASNILVNDMDGSAPEAARANPFMEDAVHGTFDAFSFERNCLNVVVHFSMHSFASC